MNQEGKMGSVIVKSHPALTSMDHASLGIKIDTSCDQEKSPETKIFKP